MKSSMINDYYFWILPSQNSLIVDQVLRGEFVFLTGPRASGKSTRLFRLRELLQEGGLLLLLVSC